MVPRIHVDHSSPFSKFTNSQVKLLTNLVAGIRALWKHQAGGRTESLLDMKRQLWWMVSLQSNSHSLIPDCFFDNENVTNAKSRSDLTTKETETLSLQNPLPGKLIPPLLHMPRLVRQELFHARSSPSSE